MIEWLDDFYGSDDMRETLLRQFLPVFSGYVTEAVGPVSSSFVQSLAESYVDRHLGSSRAQLQELVKGSADPLADLSRRFDEWEEKRPGKVAQNELVRSANAAAVERMRETGVTKKVWRASGAETCPFCQSLDGTVIAVDGNYFEAGDELNPEGATAPIHFESSLGHPPVHQGCVCSVEAVTETETEADSGATMENLQALGVNVDPTDLELQLLGPHLGLDTLPPEMLARLDSYIENFTSRFPIAGGPGFRRLRVAQPGQFGLSKTDFAVHQAGGITLNAEFFSSSAGIGRLENVLRRQVEVGWAHGTTVESGVFQHEFGHALDSYLRFDRRSPFNAYDSTERWEAYEGWRSARTRAATGYGKGNVDERIAEFVTRALDLPASELTAWEKRGLELFAEAGIPLQ